MKKILFATGNEDKMVEIRMIMKNLPLEIQSLKDAGIDVDIEENGKTFLENAMIKVNAIGTLADTIVLADDSGLAVDALQGEPGIYSARYLGRETPYAEKNQYIINALKGKTGKERSARFVCAIAALLPDGTTLSAVENMEGEIAYEAAGCGGFGYDPILYLPEYQKTSAEISAEEKNAISHRGKALRNMCEQLKGYL